MNDPSYRWRSPRKRNPPFLSGFGIETDVEQVRVAVPRPDDGGSDQPAEERVRAVRPALELRVRLGPDPERMLGELDELDEPFVGREPRTAQPGLFEPLAVP